MDGFCYVCSKEKHRYTCPRCNIRYCSLPCYKNEKHADCSELFYRDWFIKEMKERKITDTEKKLLLEKIKKVVEENPIVDFFDEPETSLEERLQGLNLQELKEHQTEDLWSRLNPREQEEFLNMAKTGFSHLGKTLNKPWTPWWLTHTSGLVTEIKDKNEESFDEDFPYLPSVLQVSPLEALKSAKTLSPLICFNLLEIIYCYVFFQRLYNGCGSTEFSLDFSDACISSSDVLKINRTFNNSEEALCSCLQKCCRTAKTLSLTTNKQLPFECIQDVSHVLMGPNPQSVYRYVHCCLSDLHSTCSELRDSLKSKNSNQIQVRSVEGNVKDVRTHLFKVIKKLEFLIAWSFEHTEQLALLSIEVTEIYKTKIKELIKDTEINLGVNENINHSAQCSSQQKNMLIVELE